MTKSERKHLKIILDSIQKIVMDEHCPIKYSSPLSVIESRIKQLLNIQPTLFP